MNDLLQGQRSKASGPVECLGQTFESDDARRAHFLALLAEKLKDPAFRKQEGFPQGTDEAILAMSDPPYYTACPNPWLAEFVGPASSRPGMIDDATIGRQDAGPTDVGPTDATPTPYSREPLAIDVSVGKTDPIYKAHSYHTKVPHLAIVPSVLHYTEPGDVVLDGFAGSGMTGVAAQWCGTAPASYRLELEQAWKSAGRAAPKWGARRAVLNDLSPAATFIAANYNIPFDVDAFAKAGKQLLQSVEQDIGWMYETLHVEPASSRLKQTLAFEPCDPFQASSSDVEPAPSRLKHPPSLIIRKDHLPHVQVAGATYFVTFRTASRRVLSPAARDEALAALRFWDGKRWRLFSAVVMPDHVHIVVQPLKKETDKFWDLSDLLHSVKSFGANKINQVEAQAGIAVWQSESYDRIIRDEAELLGTLAYIYRNPIRAKLCGEEDGYAWRVVAEELVLAGWKPAPLGRIEYTVWSEVFSCPDCAGEVNFLNEALDEDSKRVRDNFPCPHCNAELTKKKLERVYISKLDRATGNTLSTPKRVPSLISYRIGKTRYEKKPDATDLALLEKIDALPLPGSVPVVAFPFADMWEAPRMRDKGITYTHHMFLPRAAQAMGTLWAKAKAHPDARIRAFLIFMVEQAILGLSVLNRYGPTHFSQVNRMLTGVYYVASQHSECSPWYILGGKLNRLTKTFLQVGPASSRPEMPEMIDAGRQDAGPTRRPKEPNPVPVSVTTGTATRFSLSDDSIDYIFTDPPFGENLPYAELNFIVEAWHGVMTQAKLDAIVDRAKENRAAQKSLDDYRKLMANCFAEYFRILKPGRWMTVVFSNTQAAVWNGLQTAIQKAGFVVANVSALDKKQGSFKAVTTAVAVKQDLVISAYKPNGGLERRFAERGACPESVWDFVETHLKRLSVLKIKNGYELEFIAERDPRRVFDRMVAWFVRHDAPVPLSSQEFQEGLSKRFPERDGMVFLPEQVIEYDKKRAQTAQAPQMEMWVDDERSAIDWLADFLKARPSTYQDIHPEFIRQLGVGWKKHETRPELSALLEANFLRFEGTGEVPSQIHRYLSSNYHDLRGLEKNDPRLNARAQDRWYVPDPNKVQDLEKKREKALLREFETYKAFAGRKIKESRLEVLRAGFRDAWAKKDYATILAIAHKLPDETLQEDEKLLTLYDLALTRSEEQ
jgi:REP element-mobilizing transposase RayT